MKPLNVDVRKLGALEPKEEWNNINLNPKMEHTMIVKTKKKRIEKQ